MGYELRDYQTAAAAAILRALSERKDSRPVAVLPTGAGKSLVLAEVARAAVQDWHGRVLVLAHVKELLQQNAEKLCALLPASVAVGIHSAGLKRRDTDEPVVVAGVQSAVRRAAEFGKVNLAIVDEAHLIPPDGEGQYRTLLDALREANPGLRVAGFTATPFRLGHGLIYGGDGNIFTEKCYEVGVRELIERGFLSPLVSRTHDAGARLAGLHMRGGEFVAEEAEAAMREAGVTDRIAADATAKAQGRKAALVFAAGVDHARELADALAAASGERAEVLTGETPPDERARLLAAFRGELATDLFGEATERPLKWLVNVGVLTTGFDAPNCDCVVLARATASTGLYVQMVGRGFRRSPETGKENALVLDYGDNILRHGPVDAPEAFAGGGPGAGAVAWKRCPECEAAVPTGALKCHACGHEWPPRTREIGAGLAEAASGRAIISGEETEPVDEVDVVSAEYWEVHEKRNAPPDAPRTVQITYFCGPGRRFREWLCPEHEGFARRRSEKVWAARVQPWADKTMPTSAEACIAAYERGEVRTAYTVRLTREAGEKYIRAEAAELNGASPPPAPDPTPDRGDAWEPPAAGATAPANPEWDNPMDDLPF